MCSFLKQNDRKRFLGVAGICTDVFRKSPMGGYSWLAISSAFDKIGMTTAFYTSYCMITIYGEYKLTCSRHIYFKVHDSSCLKIIFFAVDEEIKMHLFSCFTALCLFTERIYLEHTQLKDTPERDLGSAALRYFSSLVYQRTDPSVSKQVISL